MTFEAAEAGDSVALGIVEGAGILLARLASPVVEGLFATQERFPVILCGGVPTVGSPLVAAFESKIRDIRPKADIFVSELQPVTGTLIIGLDSIGVEINAEVIARLRAGDSKMRAAWDSREKKEE